MAGSTFGLLSSREVTEENFSPTVRMMPVMVSVKLLSSPLNASPSRLLSNVCELNAGRGSTTMLGTGRESGVADFAAVFGLGAGFGVVGGAVRFTAGARVAAGFAGFAGAFALEPVVLKAASGASR